MTQILKLHLLSCKHLFSINNTKTTYGCHLYRIWDHISIIWYHLHPSQPHQLLLSLHQKKYLVNTIILSSCSCRLRNQSHLPLFLAYRFLSDIPQDNIGFRSVTTTEMIAIAMFDVPAFIAGNIISTIAIVRFIAIKYPFYMVRNKLLFSYLFAVFLLFCIRCMLDVFSDSLEWCPVFEYAIPINLGNTTYSKIHSRLSDVAYYLFTGFSVLGCIASIGTIIIVLMRKIRRKSLTQNTANANSVEVLKDGIRIFLMVLFANVLPPILQIMFINYFPLVGCSVSHSFFMVTSILAISVSPIISSALDPVIVILFSDEMKKFLKEKIF